MGGHTPGVRNYCRACASVQGAAALVGIDKCWLIVLGVGIDVDTALHNVKRHTTAHGFMPCHTPHGAHIWRHDAPLPCAKLQNCTELFRLVESAVSIDVKILRSGAHWRGGDGKGEAIEGPGPRYPGRVEQVWGRTYTSVYNWPHECQWLRLPDKLTS